jgi:hypothetical protein
MGEFSESSILNSQRRSHPIYAKSPRPTEEMTYILVYQHGSQARTASFRTEPEAVTKACALIAQGESSEFHILNEKGLIVTAERAIRDRYQGTRFSPPI